MAKKKQKAENRQLKPTPEEAHEAVFYAKRCGLTKDEALKLIREAKVAAKS